MNVMLLSIVGKAVEFGGFNWMELIQQYSIVFFRNAIPFSNKNKMKNKLHASKKKTMRSTIRVTEDQKQLKKGICDFTLWILFEIVIKLTTQI